MPEKLKSKFKKNILIHFAYMHSANPRLRVKKISANIKAAVTSKKICMVEALLNQW